MRRVQRIDQLEFRINKQKRDKLAGFMAREFEAVAMARGFLEREWNENLRRYNGHAIHEIKHIPYEGAPNVEFTIGAMMCDALYAQSIDLTFNSVQPIITAMPVGVTRGQEGAERVKDAQGFQDWLNYGSENEYGLRHACEHGYLDNIQQGTFWLTTLWEESVKKTGTHQTVQRGPRIRAVPLEDCFISTNVTDPEEAAIIGIRHWIEPDMMALYGQLGNWDVEKAKVTSRGEWVRSNRERLGHVKLDDKSKTNIYEVIVAHVLCDIDDDGIAEDVVVAWDRTSREVLQAVYNPFQRRPYTVGNYQVRAHMLYGMGVMEMVRPFQEGLTMFANDWLANSYLANTKMYQGPPGVAPSGTVRVWPGKYLETSGQDAITELKMSDVYNSGFIGIQFMQSLATMRTGVTEQQTLAKPSQAFGSRTPGITALSAIQQQNKRFASAFDQMRLAAAAAVRQAQYRYQERLLAGDEDVVEHIIRVMGAEKGPRVIRVLRDPDFENGVSIQMAASSASINREADRQAHIQILGVVSQYYQGILEMSSMLANGAIQGEAAQAAVQIRDKAADLVARVLRTYPQMRDAERFVIDFTEELDALPVAQSGLDALGRTLGDLTAAQGGGFGSPGQGSLNGGAAG